MLKYLWYTHIKEYCAAFKNHIVRWSDVQHCLKEKARYKSRLLYTQRRKFFKRYANSYCHRWTYEWILKSSFACKFSPFFSTVMCIAFEIRQGRMGNNKNYFVSQGKKKENPPLPRLSSSILFCQMDRKQAQTPLVQLAESPMEVTLALGRSFLGASNHLETSY